MEMNDKLVSVIDAICEKFGIAIDWTSENIIPYLTTLFNKLISYGIWSSVAWIGIMVVADIAWLIFTRVFRSVIKESIDDFGLLGMLVTIVSMILLVSTIGVIGTQIFDIVKCVTFPEMYAFEYINGILNTTD